MTIIVAVKDKENKRIILGTDSLANNNGIKCKAGSKILKLNIPICDGYGEIIDEKPLYIGLSGYGYLKHYLQYAFDVPLLDSQQDFLDYLYNDFLAVLRECLIANNLVELENSKLHSYAGLIFIFDGKFYNINSSLSVDIIEDDFMVEGSGWEVATGSIYTNLNYHKNTSIEEVVKQAIECCGNTTIYCDDKINMEIIPY